MRFGVPFIAIAASLFALYAFPFSEGGSARDLLQSYLVAYARLVGMVLRLFEPSVTVQGSVISGSVSLEIVRNCDAMEANILLASAILAFPAPPGRKFISIALGLLGVTIANVARIVSLYFVLLLHEESFEFIHIELWPLLLTLITGALFLLGVRYMSAASPQRHGPIEHGSAA